MKKNLFITFILLLFAITALVAGCGQKSSETSAPAPKEAGQSNSSSDDTSAQSLITKGMAVKNISYDCEVSLPEGEKMTMKALIKGKKMRTEMPNPEGGGNIISIIDSDQGFVYIYQPDQKTATKMGISMSQQDNTPSPQDTMESLNADIMKYIGKETIDGKTCLVYEFQDGNQETSKIWLWEDYGIPLKIESIMDGKKSVLEYRNVKTDEIPDSMFEIPEGTTIMEFNMPGQ
ncbi:MAG: lipoprotein [Syntrophomonas sp.]|nr:lipoprotein [Syntrophomonas sp.]